MVGEPAGVNSPCRKPALRAQESFVLFFGKIKENQGGTAVPSPLGTELLFYF